MTTHPNKHGPVPGTSTYEVQSHDTIEKIALRYNISPSELVKMNKLISRLIYPGQKMVVPATDETDGHLSLVVGEEEESASAITNPRVGALDSTALNGSIERPSGHPTTKPQKSSVTIHRETPADSSEENDPIIQNFVKCPALYLHPRGSTPLLREHSSVLGGILLVTPNLLMFDSSPQIETATPHSFTLELDAVVVVALYRDLTLQYTINDPHQKSLLSIDEIRTIIPAGDPIAKTSRLSPSPSPPYLSHDDHVIGHLDYQSKSWEIGLASAIGRSLSLSSSSRDSDKRVNRKRAQTISSESQNTSTMTGASQSLSSIPSLPHDKAPNDAFVHIITESNGGGCKPVVAQSGAEGFANNSLDADDNYAKDDFWFRVEFYSAQKIFLFLEQCFKTKKRRSQESTEEDIHIEPIKNTNNDELPQILGQTEILDELHILELSSHLPPRAIGYYWILAYSTSLHGFSLSTFYRKMKLCDVDSPVLLVIRDKASQIFGALTSCPLIANDHFYGTGETFLYTFHPSFKIFKWSGENSFFIKGDSESIVIGAGNGLYGLWLDADFYHGRTHKCATFDNQPLTVDEDFVVDSLEAWYFGDPPPDNPTVSAK